MKSMHFKMSIPLAIIGNFSIILLVFLKPEEEATTIPMAINFEELTLL